MQNKTKNNGIIGGAIAHTAQRLRSPWQRLVTTGVVNFKKKPFERKRSLCCESFLAGTQVQIQNLFIITVGKWSSYCQPREHLERVFFSATERMWMFFWTEELCRIVFLPMCTSRIYSVHVYIFSKINQSLTPPPPPQKWSARQTVEFPASHISFVTQHVLHAPATSNISGQMHVLCIRNFVTYAGLMQTGKWPLLKIRGQWAMRFPDISVTTAFGSVSYRQSLFTTGDYSTEITSKLTFQCLYSNLIFLTRAAAV